MTRWAIGTTLIFALGACDHWPGVSDGGAPPSGGTHIDDTSGRLGSSCGANGASCFSGLTCVTQLPAGMCTRACQSDADCQGGACTLDATLGLVCFPRCTSDVGCRPGYACTSTGDAQICTPAPTDGG